MGREIHDWDLATSATPQQIQNLFGEIYVDVGAEFGISGVKTESGLVEIGTFRKDGKTKDHRHPEKIEYGTLEDDALRRDFTMNALFLDVENPAHVVDLVGGLNDLRARVLRCVGEPRQRFEEDFLRPLRALRFVSVMELKLDPATEQALRDFRGKVVSQVHSGLLAKERVFKEMDRMFTESKHAGQAWALLSQFGYEAALFPGLKSKIGVEQNEILKSCSSDVGLWFFLCHFLGRAFEDHLVLGRNKRRTLQSLLSRWNELNHYENLRKGEKYLLWLSSESMWMPEILRILGKSNFEMDQNYVGQHEKFKSPLVTGTHLITWGIQEPEKLKTLLKEIRLRQLEESLNSLEEAQAYVESQ